jgi:hypothetical protein
MEIHLIFLFSIKISMMMCFLYESINSPFLPMRFCAYIFCICTILPFGYSDLHADNFWMEDKAETIYAMSMSMTLSLWSMEHQITILNWKLKFGVTSQNACNMQMESLHIAVKQR